MKKMNFIKNVLKISEEKNDFEKAKLEFSFYGQIKPENPVQSPLFDNPDKKIKWGILFYNDKTNTPFICSTRSQYYMRNKKTKKPFLGKKQTRNGDGSSKHQINENFYLKLNKIYEKICNKPLEQINSTDKHNLLKIYYILQSIKFDVDTNFFEELFEKVVELIKSLNLKLLS